MKGRILKSWPEAEHEQLNKVLHFVRQMVASGNSRSDIYDYITEQLTSMPSRVLIYAGMIAGEMLKDRKRIVEEEIQHELQEG